MTTSWNSGDTVEFDIAGTVSPDRDRGSVGCKTFPLSVLLRHADSVTVHDGRFQAVGVKPPAEFVGSDYVNILHDGGSVRFTARELDGYATTVRVSRRGPVDPMSLPWQDGDAIYVHTGGHLGAREGYGVPREQGVYVLSGASGRTSDTSGEFRHVNGDRIVLYGVDNVLRRQGPVNGDFSDIALKDFTVLVRGGEVVTHQQESLAVGDRVRISNPAYTTARNEGYVSPRVYGREGRLRRKAASEGCWSVEVPEVGLTQTIHEKYLTKI